jgi:hypothetical protein
MRHIELLQKIITHGIELEIYSPDLLEQLKKHFNQGDKYTTEEYHYQSFLVLFSGQAVAKININKNHLWFEFAEQLHIYPVIMETLQYLYNMRWN